MKIWLQLILPAALLFGCSHTEIDKEIVLNNMPVNSNKRCVGIAVVIEALLEHELKEKNTLGSDNDIAASLYQSLNTDSPVFLPPNFKSSDRLNEITDKRSLDNLGTLITDLYKNDYSRVAKSKEKITFNHSLYRKTLKTKKSLINILKADADQFEVFMGTGKRTFDDGKIKSTYHAFILGLNEQGKIVVLDPNDPGKAIECTVMEEPKRVTVEWRCKYRDTGHTTTQCYSLISHRDYFELLFNTLSKLPANK